MHFGANSGHYFLLILVKRTLVETFWCQEFVERTDVLPFLHSSILRHPSIGKGGGDVDKLDHPQPEQIRNFYNHHKNTEAFLKLVRIFPVRL